LLSPRRDAARTVNQEHYVECITTLAIPPSLPAEHDAIASRAFAEFIDFISGNAAYSGRLRDRHIITHIGFRRANRRHAPFEQILLLGAPSRL